MKLFKNKYVRNAVIGLVGLEMLCISLLPQYLHGKKEKAPESRIYHEFLLTIPGFNITKPLYKRLLKDEDTKLKEGESLNKGETMVGISYGVNFGWITAGLAYAKNFGSEAEIFKETQHGIEEGKLRISSSEVSVLFEIALKRVKDAADVGISINPTLGFLTAKNTLNPIGETKQRYNSTGITFGLFIKPFKLFKSEGWMGKYKIEYKFLDKNMSGERIVGLEMGYRI